MSKLLSQDEKVVCENIVKNSDSINAKRAKVLLLIDEGITHAKAAEISTLSIGQVKYILTKYKSIGLSYFPNELTALKEEALIVETKQDIKIINSIDEVQDIKEKVNIEKKPKKDKKDKKKKKDKKTPKKKDKKVSKKKDKKSKKSKKSKNKKKK